MRFPILTAAIFLSALSVEAQFPLPIPQRPASFPLSAPTEERPVVAWGDSSFGQTNVPADLFAAVQVAAGERHALALRKDGTVVGWGANSAGESTTPAGLSNVVQTAAGRGFSVVLKSNGSLAAWGTNWAGQTNLPAGLNNVVQITAGFAHAAALKQDGRVVAWGYNKLGQCNVPANLSNVVQIAAGDSHCVALKSDGTVVAWGANWSGQINIPAGLSNVVRVSPNIALKSDGKLVAWGSEFSSQDLPAGVSNAVAIASSGEHGGLIRTNGTAVVWGEDWAGQASAPASLANVRQLALAPGGYSLALGTTATMTLGGTNMPAFSTTAGTPSATRTFTASGSNLTGPVVISAPDGFALALSNAPGAVFAPSISLTPQAGALANTTVYVRLTGASGGAFAGTIEVGTRGAIPARLTVSGNVIQLPDPTPTVTPVPSVTPTPGVTPTPTPGPSPTPSVTPPTPTPPPPTPNPSPTPTLSPSPSPSPTVTPAPSPTPTVTPVPSVTPTPGVTPTPTPGPSPTPSVTPPTPTPPPPTPEPSPTPTLSPSPSPSPTVTPAPSPTPTVTPVPSVTPTPTPDPSPTPTPNPSVTPTPTVTPGPFPTPTPPPPPSPQNLSGYFAGSYESADASNAADILASHGKLAITASKGKFSGSLIVGGKKTAVRGAFDGAGRADVALPKSGILITMLLEGTADYPFLDVELRNRGKVFTFDLLPSAAVVGNTTEFPFDGFEFNALLPASADTLGHGFVTATAGKNAGFKIAGTLADGTKFTASATALADGQEDGRWILPVTASLASVKGLISGSTYLAEVVEDGGEQWSGELAWARPANPKAKIFPGGLATRVAVMGTAWQRAKGANLMSGMMNHSMPFVLAAEGKEHPGTWPASNKPEFDSADKNLKLGAKATGHLAGTVPVIVGGKSSGLRFSGLLLGEPLPMQPEGPALRGGGFLLRDGVSIPIELFGE